MTQALAILSGYLLGSISPAFFLGKILKGIDIREHGTKNAGATNVKKVLGLGPAIITAIFDLSKGLLAIWIAMMFGLPPIWAYFAGIAALVGHIFPFYLRFYGGQGAATATGLLFYFLIRLVISGNINWADIITPLITLVILSISILVIIRQSKTLAVFVLPPTIFFLVANSKLSLELYFAISILFFLLLLNIFLIIKTKVFQLVVPEDKTEHLLNWRTFARPLAILFIVFAFLWPKIVVLYIAGIVAAFFILLDLVRLIFNRANLAIFGWRGFLKQKEKRSFSSMTFFLTATFILFLLFPIEIASISLLFITFGDLAAKFFGIFYSKIFFWDKSLEGSLAYFVFGLLAATIFIQIVPFPYYLVVLGALTATLVDIFSPFGIDDNFTVGLISAAVILAIKVFV